ICALVGLCLTAVPAHAASRTFVSSAGAGTACTRSAPCADFQTAHDATTSGGTVYCLDPGDYGGAFGLTVTKTPPHDRIGTKAGMTAAFSPVPITINGARIVVVLRGLSLQGAGVGHIGVSFINGGELHVDHCEISGFHAGGFAHGIRFAPPDGVIAQLYVT